MTRYAAQQLYAPERVIVGDANIKRVLVNKTAIPLIRGGKIEAIPIASWKGGGLFVTAVKLRNRSEQRLTLVFDSIDKPVLPNRSLNLPQQIRGHWLTVTPQHRWLGKVGSEGDTTVLYLVSKRSFIESIEAFGKASDG